MTPATRTSRRRLIVTWKSDSNRQIVPVAELLVDEVDGRPVYYELGYLEGFRQAVAVGFQPFMAFPDPARRYGSNALFPFFQNRVLPTTRPDYLESVLALGLDPARASYADVLGRSNAQRATDRIETVLVPERNASGEYSTHFLVRGVRHAAGAEAVIATLQVGDRLVTELDTENPHNPRARKLIAQGTRIGFLPDYLVADFAALEARGSLAAVTVERVNPPPKPAHHRVLCRMTAEWPDGFIPFEDPMLDPYDATPRPAAVA
jgi:hypothetical protein